jgi:hypothetical protein
MASLQAELGAFYASIGDDTGLAYAVRRHMAYLKAALGTLEDLETYKSREHQP